MPGPIKISVVTNALAARRDLASIARTVTNLSKVATLRFDKGAFTRDYANPSKSSFTKMFRDQEAARKFFERKAAREPVGKAPEFTDKGVTFRRAIKNYAALGGEARVTLSQINRRIEHFEVIGTDAYNKVTGRLEQYKDAASRTTGKLKLMAAAAVAINIGGRGISAVTGYLKTAVTNASALGETTSKSKQIFKDGAGSVIAFSKTADRSLGLSQTAALDAASSFSDMFQQLGLGAKQSAKLSTGTLQLAADLGSFSNVDVADVTDRISSAYRGEYDGLQKLVPNINAARVQTEALALSHKKSAKELTAADRALAVNAIITKDASRAQGDFARTSDSLANVNRANTAGLQNLSATVGTALLPGITALAVAFRDRVLPALNELVSKYAPKVNAFMTAFAAKGLGASSSMTGLGESFESFKTIGTSLKELSGPALDGVGSALKITATILKTVADHIDAIVRLVPVFVGGYVLYKGAVIAANLAATAQFPLKVAELVVNRQLIKSNMALIASREGVTAATVVGTQVEGVSTLAKIRGAAASLGARVAMLAGAVATGIMTVATGALNLVMLISPVGLVVIAVIALAAAFVYAYKHSEKFRAIVNGVFGALKSGVLAAVGFVRKNWPTILAVLTGPIGLAFLAFKKYKGKIVSVFTSIKSTVVSVFSGIGDTITSALRAAVNSAIDLVNSPLAALNKVASKVPGMSEVPLIPKLASGGIVRARSGGTLALLAEAGRDEAVIPLGSRRFGGDTYNVNVTVQSGISNPADVGRTVVQAIQTYERSKGRRMMSNAS